MDDLISRQAAIAAVCMTFCGSPDRCRFFADCGNLDEIRAVRPVAALYDYCPTGGARPEIIHCRECKYGVDYYHEGDCYCSNPKWGLEYLGGSWDFYCADAEWDEE